MDQRLSETIGHILPTQTFGRLNQGLRGIMVAGNTQKTSPGDGKLPSTTLAWGRAYLPAHFAKPASRMHEWLDAELDALRTSRGCKVNVIGPRGSAKSTIATLCYVLRAAVEGWERYIWIVSDTKEQAQTHLDNVKAELVDNRMLRHHYPNAVGHGRRWRATSIELANGVMIESYGTGQRIRGRRARQSVRRLSFAMTFKTTPTFRRRRSGKRRGNGFMARCSMPARKTRIS